ncbi:MAG: SIS domain-containing protein [Clostridium sp.]|uniref:SIS domain-containing protein n=1 Tax=Clostridium sp. TaxID=1506 RepID=UPI00290B1C5C|nr:SIS domain-containing protein [Clostridium sp.]MDU5110800.1 SIS domain-containing protein [Clostridium sp.]
MENMLYFELAKKVISDLEECKNEIKKAGEIIADSIMNGGILITFGSGHSNAGAIEVAGRAGGLVPAIAMEDVSHGVYERIEGVGKEFLKTWDLRENDCVVIISNSGRNPLPIEVAEFVKNNGNKLIVVTSKKFSQSVTSRHSSGKKLYEFADVILDNHVEPGDSSIELEGLDCKIGPTSTLSTVLLLNQAIVYAVEKMLSCNYKPPVYLSANLDAGLKWNNELMEKYFDRLRKKM